MVSQAGTVGEAMDSFLESKSSKEFKTIERYKLDIERYLKPKLGRNKLSNLTAEQIEKAYAEIRSEHVLSNNSMVHLHATLRGAIKRSLRLKKIKNNPLDGVEAPSRIKSNVNPLTQSEMREVLRLAENEKGMWPSLWRITLLTGFRQGEVMGLNWEDVDFEEGTLRLHQQIQRQTGRGLVLKELKAHAKGRKIMLDSKTLAYLRNWKRAQAQYRLSLEKWNENNFIFTNSVGNPMEPRKATSKWAELLRNAGLIHLNLHGARHTFATVMMDEKIDIKLVSYYLGHSNITTTMNIYQHISKDALSQTAKTIGEVAM
jgi:integrase